MAKRSLALGFSAEERFERFWKTIPEDMKKVMKKGYGGGMLFDYRVGDNSNLMELIAEAINKYGSV